ncbi:hypothetical protein [Orrella sp. 11846]|uniref:hypothetical protein n=1 Tax=Orrella sp. 11846 TaxID=3409913 RepID=UPI003B5A8697
MRKATYIRPLIAGLALTLASGVAMAQGHGKKHDGEFHSQRGGQNCQQFKKHGDRGFKMGAGMQMQLPAPVLEQLKLTDAQKLKYHDAQTASKAMFDANRERMQKLRKADKEAAPNFDPKAMFEQQNERFAQFQKSRETIQGQWLGFWDSLSADQRSIIQTHYKDRFEQRKARGERKGGKRAAQQAS